MEETYAFLFRYGYPYPSGGPTKGVDASGAGVASAEGVDAGATAPAGGCVLKKMLCSF